MVPFTWGKFFNSSPLHLGEKSPCLQGRIVLQLHQLPPTTPTDPRELLSLPCRPRNMLCPLPGKFSTRLSCNPPKGLRDAERSFHSSQPKLGPLRALGLFLYNCHNSRSQMYSSPVCLPSKMKTHLYNVGLVH